MDSSFLNSYAPLPKISKMEKFKKIFVFLSIGTFLISSINLTVSVFLLQGLQEFPIFVEQEIDNLHIRDMSQDIMDISRVVNATIVPLYEQILRYCETHKEICGWTGE
tara:strand:- start:16 stop:339 length:324 start_codon:yes stop_codon:yes gene_type:complete